MSRISIIKLRHLKAHEKISVKNLNKVKKLIKKAAHFTVPIIVDKKNLVILDGHHRAQAMKDLGYKKIPATMVDYADKKIKVFSRRKSVKIDKNVVIERALNNKLFKFKTTKHYIPGRGKTNILLDRLL